MPITSSGCHLGFSLFSHGWEVPRTPSLGLMICWNSSQSSGKQFTYQIISLS